MNVLFGWLIYDFYLIFVMLYRILFVLINVKVKENWYVKFKIYIFKVDLNVLKMEMRV